jgi:uncharacterized protein (TIGR00725 family)
MSTAKRLAIGVMGSASEDAGEEVAAKVMRLGRAVAERGCVLVTGGCPGLPYAAARGAQASGGLAIGISPGLSREEHERKYGSPADAYDVLIYTGSGLMGREVLNIRSSDIVVIAGGRSGTLGEFAIAYDEGKLIGVLTGTGGIADRVDDLVRLCQKDTGAAVLYDDDPIRLLDRLIEYYLTQHIAHPNCFCTPVRTTSTSDREQCAASPT